MAGVRDDLQQRFPGADAVGRGGVGALGLCGRVVGLAAGVQEGDIRGAEGQWGGLTGSWGRGRIEPLTRWSLGR